MSGYTPGPWSYEIVRKGSPNRDKLAIFADGDVIAMAYGDGSDTQHDGQANARLIAAAPEMLAELEETKLVLSWCQTERFQSIQLQARVKERLAAIDALIAHAESRS